jgi:hypothetical protein
MHLASPMYTFYTKPALYKKVKILPDILFMFLKHSVVDPDPVGSETNRRIREESFRIQIAPDPK